MDFTNNQTNKHIETQAIETIKRIYNKPDWISHADERIRHKEFILPDEANESLDKLVKLYVNKKSKRVGYAGNKLKRMFLHLPPVNQRKVGIALLNGNLTDSEWVCKQLDNHKPLFSKNWKPNWHPKYSEAVEQCWNNHHGKNCGRLLSKYVDEEIVRRHIDELTDDDYYFFLCRRFVDKPWFKLDIEKLKNNTYINAYLHVMSKTSSGISADEARVLLYQWIAVIAIHSEKILYKPEKIFYDKQSMKLRVINAWGIDTALYYLLCMGHNKVVSDFIEWDNEIFCKYYSSFEDNQYSEKHKTECNFARTIIENFPKDLMHLTVLDEAYYMYINAPSQPFTKPRINPWSDDIGYYSIANDIPGLISGKFDFVKDETISSETYNQILKNNPSLVELIDRFDLTPVNIRQNPESNAD